MCVCVCVINYRTFALPATFPELDPGCWDLSNLRLMAHLRVLLPVLLPTGLPGLPGQTSEWLPFLTPNAQRVKT